MQANGLIQITYVDEVQLRGIYSGNEIIQILASTLERKQDESGKDSPFYGRWVHSIRAGGRRFEFDEKTTEPGQCGRTHDH